MPFSVWVHHPTDDSTDDMETVRYDGVVDVMNLPRQGIKFIHDDQRKEFPGGEIVRIRDTEIQ